MLKSGTNRKQKKVIGVVVGSVVVVVCMVFALIVFINRIEHNNIANDPTRIAMVNYLAQKYGGDFIVGETRVEGSGLGVTGYTLATAEQTGKGIEFTVGKSDAGFYDSYHNSLWSNQQQPVVDELTSQMNEIKPVVTVSISPSQTLKNELGGQLPSYMEIRKQSSEELIYLVEFQITTNEGHYGEIVQNLSSNLNGLANYMDSQSVGREYIGIKIITSDKMHYTCELSSEVNDIATKVSDLNGCFKKSIN